MKHKAIYETHPDVVTISGDRAFDNDGNEIVLNQSLVTTKLAELQAVEPLRQLRLERTRKLAQSDWMANSDVTMTEEWRVYRQALRDITTQTPSLDENGQLTGINWPTPPEA